MHKQKLMFYNNLKNNHCQTLVPELWKEQFSTQVEIVELKNPKQIANSEFEEKLNFLWPLRYDLVLLD